MVRFVICGCEAGVPPRPGSATGSRRSGGRLPGSPGPPVRQRVSGPSTPAAQDEGLRLSRHLQCRNWASRRWFRTMNNRRTTAKQREMPAC